MNSASASIYTTPLLPGSFRLEEAIERVRPFTMLSEPALQELALQVSAVLAYDIAGSIVECGVWRGGASFLAADVLGHAGADDRKVWLFDSFEGLPDAKPVDGGAALAYARRRDDPGYFDNCRASLEEVSETAAALGLASQVEIVKGWFDETLETSRDRIGPIAILRLDCDWYESTKSALNLLYDQVTPGGLISIDDYFTYEGCALAVHEFLGERGLHHRIEPVVRTDSEGFSHYYGALLRKGGTTWNWLQRLLAVRVDISSLLPEGSSFILVDQDWFGPEVATGRRAIPFLEQDGIYGGPPANDDLAIAEFERLRVENAARFIIFGWPAFWWLQFYEGFRSHLDSHFNCALRNERIVAYDLAVS